MKQKKSEFVPVISISPEFAPQQIGLNAIILNVKNVSDETKKIKLFGSPASFLRNKDPEVLIKQRHANPDYQYEDTLWAISSTPVFIARIHLNIVTNNPARVLGICGPLVLERNTIDGNHSGSISPILLSPLQYQNTSFDIDYPVNEPLSLSALSSICFKLPGNTEIILVVYVIPAAFDHKTTINRVTKMLQELNSHCDDTNYRITKDVADLEKILSAKRIESNQMLQQVKEAEEKQKQIDSKKKKSVKKKPSVKKATKKKAAK